MAKFAFIVPPFVGHVNPTLSVGAELLRRGHRVAWIGLDDSLYEQVPVGGEVFWAGGSDDGETASEHDQYRQQITQNRYTGIESIKFLYEDVLIPLNGYLYPGICQRLREFSPDVVVHDHEVFAGAFAAQALDLPYATMVTAPASIRLAYDLPGVHAWTSERTQRLQTDLGLAGNLVSISSNRVLVTTVAAFFGPLAGELPIHFRFTGPLIQHRTESAAFDWNRFHQLPGSGPRVLISIGTTFDHATKQDFFDKVVQAFAGEAVRIVLVSDPALRSTWPANFYVCQRIPQLALMPHLDGVICHGGQNTVFESLAHGLPIVVIPIAYDQSYVAGRLVDTGCGVRLNFRRFNASQLRDALQTVIGSIAYRQQAAAMQTALKQAGGTAYAASQLEELINP